MNYCAQWPIGLSTSGLAMLLPTLSAQRVCVSVSRQRAQLGPPQA